MLYKFSVHEVSRKREGKGRVVFTLSQYLIAGYQGVLFSQYPGWLYIVISASVVKINSCVTPHPHLRSVSLLDR